MACCLLVPLANAQWPIGFTEQQWEQVRGDSSILGHINNELLLASQWTVSKKAMPHLRKVETLFAQLSDTLPSVHTDHYRRHYHFLMGYQCKVQRDISSALGHLQQALAYTERIGDPVLFTSCHDALGVLLMSVREHELAEAQFRKAMALIPDIGTQRSSYLIYSGGHLVGVLAAQGRIAEAQHLVDSIATAYAHGNADQALLLTYRAKVAEHSGDTGAALTYLLQAEALMPAVWDRLTVRTALARTQNASGLHAEARNTADSCIAYASAIGDEAAECGCLVLGAEARLAMGQQREAENDLLRALRIATDNGYMGLARELGDEGSMVHITGILKDLYTKQGRTADALRMTTLWAAYKDTLHAMEGREELLRFDLHRQLTADSLLRAEAANLERINYEGRLADERDRRGWIIALSASIVVFLSLLAYSFAKRSKQERRLSALERERLEQEKVIAEMRIRDQVGRDMHDDLGAGLSALRLRSELAERNEIDPLKRERLSAMARQAEELMSSMRQIIWAMNADGSDLRSTLDHCIAYATGYLSENQIRCTVERSGVIPEIPLTPQQRRNLFLVVKECLHNTVKHAQARQVIMKVIWADSTLHLNIRDDGRGMTQAESDHNGRGLLNMAGRVKELNGTFTWRNDGGLCTDVKFPFGKPGSPPTSPSKHGHDVGSIRK